jgi:hypothetical protein
MLLPLPALRVGVSKKALLVVTSTYRPAPATTGQVDFFARSKVSIKHNRGKCDGVVVGTTSSDSYSEFSRCKWTPGYVTRRKFTTISFHYLRVFADKEYVNRSVLKNLSMVALRMTVQSVVLEKLSKILDHVRCQPAVIFGMGSLGVPVYRTYGCSEGGIGTYLTMYSSDER